jgi:hypothetical protein
MFAFFSSFQGCFEKPYPLAAKKRRPSLIDYKIKGHHQLSKSFLQRVKCFCKKEKLVYLLKIPWAFLIRVKQLEEKRSITITE